MVMQKPVNWIVDVDIKGFFDNVNHHWLIECINQKISDPNFKSLIIRFLKAGVMEQGQFSKTEQGTPQGGVLSPLLANIYMHYVLDLWFEKVEKKNIKGYTQLIRYADDFVIGAQTKPEAYQILQDLKDRLKKFSLEVSEEKTSIKEFGRYADYNSKRRGKRKPDTFNFLGFTHYCSKSRKGNFLMKMKTNVSRQSKSLSAINVWIKTARNTLDIKKLWERVSSKLQGHYNYYGVSSNSQSINNYYYSVNQLLYRWLNRRSQKQSYTWKTFSQHLKTYPLPKPTLVYSLYQTG